MNIKKIIAAVLCLSVLVSKTASGHDIIGQNQTEVTLMASASEAKEVIKILPATVNSEYKQVLVDGSTTNMDDSIKNTCCFVRGTGGFAMAANVVGCSYRKARWNISRTEQVVRTTCRQWYE